MANDFSLGNVWGFFFPTRVSIEETVTCNFVWFQGYDKVSIHRSTFPTDY